MRLSDLSDGSIKTLLILILLAANIFVALSRHHAPSSVSAADARAASAHVEKGSR